MFTNKYSAIFIIVDTFKIVLKYGRLWVYDIGWG